VPYFTIESLKSIEKDKNYRQKWGQVLIFDGGHFEELVLTEKKVKS
jgi:hypothetical protein